MSIIFSFVFLMLAIVTAALAAPNQLPIVLVATAFWLSWADNQKK